MGIIPKVKCSRCEKSYSGLQSKCPYCGARRSKGGKFSMPEQGDPKWRLAVGVLLLVAVICTVIALANINKGGGGASTAAGTSPTPSGAEASPSPDISDVTTSDIAQFSPSPSPSPMDSVESITIKWLYYGGTNEMTIQVGTEVELTAEVYPTTASADVEWSSENPGVCTVDESGNIKGVSSGNTTITAEYNGVQGDLIVRVR